MKNELINHINKNNEGLITAPSLYFATMEFRLARGLEPEELVGNEEYENQLTELLEICDREEQLDRVLKEIKRDGLFIIQECVDNVINTLSKTENMELEVKIGERVTILKPNSLVPELYKGTVQCYYFGKYAQYENALFLYIRIYRGKRIQRIVLLPSDVVFIFKGFNFDKSWNKERVSENHSRLHRITYNDVKDNKDLIYHKAYGEEFVGINNNPESFIDYTGDFLCDNAIRAKEAINSAEYIEYIKQLVRSYNLNTLLDSIKKEGYHLLEQCVNKATEYAW